MAEQVSCAYTCTHKGHRAPVSTPKCGERTIFIEMVADEEEAKKLGIFGRKRAFYDALIRNKSTQELMSDETLKLIARELKEIVEEWATTDWSSKEATRAKMRTKIKECLKKYNYPPEYQKQAIDDVVRQAEYIMNDE